MAGANIAFFKRNAPHIAEVLKSCSAQDRLVIEEQIEALKSRESLIIADRLYANVSTLLDPAVLWRKEPNHRS